jgi:hypothetical protein
MERAGGTGVASNQATQSRASSRDRRRRGRVLRVIACAPRSSSREVGRAIGIDNNSAHISGLLRRLEQRVLIENASSRQTARQPSSWLPSPLRAPGSGAHRAQLRHRTEPRGPAKAKDTPMTDRARPVHHSPMQRHTSVDRPGVGTRADPITDAPRLAPSGRRGLRRRIRRPSGSLDRGELERQTLNTNKKRRSGDK